MVRPPNNLGHLYRGREMSEKVFEMISRLDAETFVEFVGEGVASNGKRYFLGSNGKKYPTRVGIENANGALRAMKKKRIAEAEVCAMVEEEKRLEHEAQLATAKAQRVENERMEKESESRIAAVLESGGTGIFDLTLAELAKCLSAKGMTLYSMERVCDLLPPSGSA